MVDSAKRCMLVFERHGERLDQVKSPPPGTKIDFAYDPPLTEEGMRQADAVAQLTKTSLLQAQGYDTSPIKFIVSPHIRTLQTAACF